MEDGRDFCRRQIASRDAKGALSRSRESADPSLRGLDRSKLEKTRGFGPSRSQLDFTNIVSRLEKPLDILRISLRVTKTAQTRGRKQPFFNRPIWLMTVLHDTRKLWLQPSDKIVTKLHR